jgi:hypothetical protein
MIDAMYLLHVRLRSSVGAVPADRAWALFACCARKTDGLEHVTIHADIPGSPVVGLFISAGSIEAAESTALAICRRALERHPELGMFTLVACWVKATSLELDPGHRHGKPPASQSS